MFHGYKYCVIGIFFRPLGDRQFKCDKISNTAWIFFLIFYLYDDSFGKDSMCLKLGSRRVSIRTEWCIVFHDRVCLKSEPLIAEVDNWDECYFE